MMTGARRAATPVDGAGRAGGASTVRSAAGGRTGPVRRRRVNTVVAIPGTVSRPECARNSVVDRRTRATGRAPSVAVMESDVCRVALHAGDRHVDLVLPNAVAVGLLLPPLCDIVRPGGGRAAPATVPAGTAAPGCVEDAARERDNRRGRPGARRSARAAPVPAGARHRRAPCPVDRIHHPVVPGGIAGRRAGGTVVLAGIGGFLAVPGFRRRTAPAPRGERGGRRRSHRRASAGNGRTAFTALAFGCALIAAATLCTSALGGTAHHTGLLLATVSTAVVVSAGRLALLLCGLSARREPRSRTRCRR